LFDNNTENEADFCEAYKSQILNNGASEKKSSLNTLSKILTILLLLIIIVVVSIYGYTYITNNGSDSAPPASMQIIDDDELIVTEEEPIGNMPPEIVEPDESVNVEKDVANEDANKSTKKESETLLKIPSSSEVAYLEELAQLSEEIDKERK
jgi:hypothetical protein